MMKVPTYENMDELARALDNVRGRLPGHVRNPDPAIYRSTNYVTLDFETTVHGNGLPIYPANRIVLAAWRLGPGHPGAAELQSSQPASRGPGADVHRYKWGGEYDLGELVREVEQADFLICHNAKFEIGWLARCGLDLTQVVVWDTQIGEYVLGGNRWRYKQLSLEASAQRRFGEGKHDIISRMFKAGLCSTEIPASWLLEYCQKDVDLTERLFLEQLRLMEEDGQLLPVMFTRCLATPVLTDIENNGMYLDDSKVVERCAELELDYSRIQQDLEEVTGGINTNSPVQLAKFLYDELEFSEVKNHHGKVVRNKPNKSFPDGMPRTDEETINKLRPSTKRQTQFLELYRKSKELYNELTKYLRKFRDCCAEADGRLVAQFNQTNTQTHRLSSSGLDYNAQFQNFPRVYKPIFRPRRDDWFIGEADGAQLEFRVAAHLGRDDVALDDILAGTDVHTVTADIIGCTRQDAKPHTFKPLYGGRSGTNDERRYYEFFRKKYRSITDTQQCWINEVLSTGELRTEWGLKYYWPDTRMEKSGYVRNSNSICNYPVQALATAEIIPIGLVYFWHYVKALELSLLVVNTVHDSIIAEIPPDEVEWFHALSMQCLVKEVYGYLRDIYGIEFSVPLAAGVSVGSHWGDEEAKEGEVTYTAEDGLYAD